MTSCSQRRALSGARGEFAKETRRLSVATRLEFGGDGLRVEVGQPVHAKQEFVVAVMQLPRAPGRQPEDDRAAQPGVRDQQRAALAQPGAGHRDFHRRQGDSGESRQRRRLQVKREQGWHRRRQRVAERDGQFPRAGARHPPVASSSRSHARVARPESVRSNPPAWLLAMASRPRFGVNRTPAARERAGGNDDGLRGISDGEHPAIAFGFELHAAGRKPGDRIAGLETLERADQRLPAPG